MLDNDPGCAPWSAQAAFQQALQLHRQGQLGAARAAYEAIRARDPGHADTAHLLGVLLAGLGQLDEAHALIGRALDINPRHPAAHVNFATLHEQRNDRPAALRSYEQALALAPRYVDAWFQRANLLYAMGQHEHAMRSYEAALAIDARHGAAHINLCHLLQHLGRHELLLAASARALAHLPALAEAHNLRGLALQGLGRLAEAGACFESALACDPDLPEAHINLGVLQRQAGQYAASIASYDRALARRPDDSTALGNRANALRENGQFDAALAGYRQALALAPDDAQLHANLGIYYLQQGQFERGWQEYEWRTQGAAPAGAAATSRWNGRDDVQGKTIVLYGEQGLGDTIQFCRYARMVAQRGARVILAVPPALCTLMSSLAGVHQVCSQAGPLPAHDLRAPLLSLPMAFQTMADSIPAPVPYLFAQPDRLAQWQARLGPRTRLRIGIACSGQALHSNDRQRSMALDTLMAQLPDDCDVIVLQDALRPADLACLDAYPALRYFGAQLGDFADTAALCMLVDLVVTVDTSVTHLSGALGRPAWVLLPASADWRWQLGRTDSPWYPGMRLFRQCGPEGRAAQLAHLRRALQLWQSDMAAAACAPLLALFQAGQYAQAERLAETLAAQFPKAGLVWKVWGAALQEQGKDALPVLHRTLELLPDDAEAHSNLACVLAGTGAHQLALHHCHRALALDPALAAAHNNLGNTLSELGQYDTAAQSYRQALVLAPGMAAAHANLGKVLKTLGQPALALACFRACLACPGRHTDGLAQLGMLLCDLQQFDEAVAHLRDALAVRPQSVALHTSLGQALAGLGEDAAAADSFQRALDTAPQSAATHFNLGSAQQALERNDAAHASYCRALVLDPDFVAARCNLGVLLHGRGQYGAALAQYRQGLQVAPDNADLHYNEGNTLKQIGQLDAAQASYRRALVHKPRFADAYCNLGLCLKETGQLEAALACYRAALDIDAQHLGAQENTGIVLLYQGQFEAGWRHFRARHGAHADSKALPVPPMPRWQGQPLQGKSLLVWREQGLGDELQFFRYATVLKQLGVRWLTLACSKPLQHLLAGIDGVDAIHVTGAASAPPLHDYWTPMLDVPWRLDTRLDTIPAAIPYLAADPGQVERTAAQLARRLAGFDGLTVGLCWKGNPAYGADAQRSIGLDALAPLFALDGIRYVSLHCDARGAFLERAAGSGVDLGHDLDAGVPPFQETAALLTRLDLVISCDTAVAHLAGALGTPVWLLLANMPDWRWMAERSDSPWYPRTTLWRQREPGDWAAVVAQVAARLRTLQDRRGNDRPRVNTGTAVL